MDGNDRIGPEGTTISVSHGVCTREVLDEKRHS